MLKPVRTLRPVSTIHSFRPHTRRTFINLPEAEAQSLSATRILPYKHTSIYKIIADIDNYSSFLPYCLDSKVTKWSSPDSNGKCWPSEADLRVGWGGYEETFTSRLFCIPDSVVEALGGEATTTLAKADLEHHASTMDAPAVANGIFQTINTRWTIRPFHYKPPTGTPQSDKTEHPARDQTEVHLTLDFQFANPFYAALSKAVTPKVAGIMIEAFETHARQILDGPGAAVKEKKTLGGTIPSGHKVGI